MYQAVIVDDEPFIVEGMKTAIEWPGFNFELCCTTSPVHALEFLNQHPADLLITDISMPQMDGIELIQKVREINPLISILVLSAYDNFDYVRAAMRHGAENYLLKPLDPDELTESISHIVAHIKERAELSGTYGSSMLTFRSSFIESWVKGVLSESEFITRAEMLGINLYLNEYTVFIFTVSSDFEKGHEQMSALFDYLLYLFVGNYISHFYFETPTRLVCIISSIHSELSTMALLDQMDKARIALNFPIFVSVGNTVNNYEDVSTSYRNASKFLFLQYSPMTQIRFCDMDLSITSVSIIEREYTTLSAEAYLTDLTKLYTLILPAKHTAFLMRVLNWGIAQTSIDAQPAPDLKKLLGTILIKERTKEFTFSYIQDFVHTCYEILTQKQEAMTSSYPCVDAVIAAVHEFSDMNISLKTLAAKLNMHPSYLGNIFHQQTGYYFNDYLNEERLKYAANLIENTDMKLKDIVDKSNFASQTYFNRQFKRKYGTTPNAYRREIKLKTL